MDFAERIKRNADRLRAMRPTRLAPTASIRVELDAGEWSAGDPGERLAHLCRACLAALGADPIPAATYDGHKGLAQAKQARLRVGVAGGRGWSEVRQGSDMAALAAQLSQAGQQALVPGPGLELVDLSESGVTDWRGSLVRPQTARLVLVGPQWLAVRPGQATGVRQAFGLAMDYDQRILDATRAVGFLDALRHHLMEGGGG